MSAVSHRAYARHRRISLSAVQRAIREQRITPLPDGKIDPVVADRQWAENTFKYPSADSSASASQFARARAVREHFAARIQKLHFEQKSARLVSADEARIAELNAFRKVSAMALAVADNVAAAVAAESDEAACHRILSAEIRKMLSDFADAMAAQASA